MMLSEHLHRIQYLVYLVKNALRLFFAPRSPFARKILVAAVELGINRRLLCTAIDPWTDVELRHTNPLGKVPTLVLPDGTSLFDSRVIVQYLSEASGGKLIPLGPPRWNALQREALPMALLRR